VFSLNGETAPDDAHHKAKEMDLGAFATPFDPHNLGILERVSRALLRKRGPGITEVELHKLNVYGEHYPSSSCSSVARSLMLECTGKGDFFNLPHKETPRNKNVVGTLLIVLPTRHEGGQLVLRQGGKEWTLDFADVFATATEPLVCFVAFFGEVEHQVLPITSGYQVTLTYNLYGKTSYPNVSSIPTPLHERIKKALVELVNDKSTLPEGGYLCSGLGHKYDYPGDKPINAMLDQLKGVDQILATVCEELGLPHSLTLLHEYADQYLIARSKYAFRLGRRPRVQ